jgi:hypothetical protein
MNKKNISFDLKFQIREYLEYIWRESSEDKSEEKLIIEQLSDILKDKLMIQSNKIVLLNNPIFKNNFSEKILSKIPSIISEYKCTPE